ncbi:MAG: hypothetical protein Q8K96_15760 [Rubrivivax sp.]|nr:hypothetical protein [Rubrivivax sp.]
MFPVRWLRSYMEHLRQHGAHHLIVSVAVANLVLLTRPLWYSIEDFVTVYSHSAATVVVANSPSEFRRVALVKLDDQRFTNSAYAGTSPLDRCALERDLSMLLNLKADSATRPDDKAIKLLAVDLDLSPTEAAQGAWTADHAERGAKPEKRQQVAAARACQEDLDTLLSLPENANRLILMAPSRSPEPSTQQKIKDWMQRMQDAKVEFGDVQLTVKRGILRTHERKPGSANPPPFGDLVRQRVLQVIHGEGPAPRADGNKAGPSSANSKSSLAPEANIMFHSLASYFRPDVTEPHELTLSSPCFAQPHIRCSFDMVIFGASYSADDAYQTTVGPLNGVDVHAAIAACEAPTATCEITRHVAWHGFEILLGVLLFAPMLHGFWRKYYFCRSGKRQDQDLQRHGAGDSVTGHSEHGSLGIGYRFSRAAALVKPSSAYVWLLIMFVCVSVAYLALLTLFPLFSGSCHLAMVPAAFVIGLALEAAVVQGTQVAAHEAHADYQTSRLPFVSGFGAARPWRDPYQWLALLLYAVLLGLAIVDLFHLRPSELLKLWPF